MKAESTSPSEPTLEAAVAPAPVLRKAAGGASNPVVPDLQPVEKDQMHSADDYGQQHLQLQTPTTSN